MRRTLTGGLSLALLAAMLVAVPAASDEVAEPRYVSLFPLEESPVHLEEFQPFFVIEGWGLDFLTDCEDGEPGDYDESIVEDDGLRFDLYLDDEQQQGEEFIGCTLVDEGTELFVKNHRYDFPDGLPEGIYQLRGEWWWHEEPNEPLETAELALHVGEVEGSDPPGAPTVVYAVSGPGPGSPGSELYQIDPTVNGQDTLIGAVQTATGASRTLTDIALADDGTMYGVRSRLSFEILQDITELYVIDPETAGATLLGETAFMDVNGLEVSPDGRILGSTSRKPTFSNKEGLVEFDPNTGEATLIGSFGPDLGSSGDLAFSPDGVLYLSARESGVTNDVLATVDPETGAATRVNPEEDLGHSTVFGLFFIGEQLFGLTRQAPECDAGALLQVDRDTATATFVRCLGFEARGATTEPQMIDEPPTDVELMVGKLWLDAEGEQTEAPAAGVLTLDAGDAGVTSEGDPSLFVAEGTAYTVSENLPEGWVEVQCPEEFQPGEIIGVPVDDPTKGFFPVIGNGTDGFTATETGIHIVCNQAAPPPPPLAPMVSVSPPAGVPGMVFAVSGSGFTPQSTATVHQQRPENGMPFPIVSVATDEDGTFAHEIDSADLDPASYEVWAIDDATTIVSNVVTFAVEATDLDGELVVFSGHQPEPDSAVTQSIGALSVISIARWIRATEDRIRGREVLDDPWSSRMRQRLVKQGLEPINHEVWICSQVPLDWSSLEVAASGWLVTAEDLNNPIWHQHQVPNEGCVDSGFVKFEVYWFDVNEVLDIDLRVDIQTSDGQVATTEWSFAVESSIFKWTDLPTGIAKIFDWAVQVFINVVSGLLVPSTVDAPGPSSPSA